LLPNAQRVLSVTELTRLIKGTLESAFPSVWVCGEVAEVTQPSSGHIYFTLRDDNAQIRAVIWRNMASRLRFALEEGLQVVCHGELDVYLARGSYQLSVRHLEPVGVGSWQLALRQLYQRLAAEGLFDERRKRPLPDFPQRIALVTSPTGAVVHDFLQIARRRFRGVHILIVPTRVQGEGAAEEIVAALAQAQRVRPPLDVLVVARGGGSVEDLACFNEENVVRAIARSRIPVVSAVGHGIDQTLADMAADLHAATPSEAAERVIPSAADLRQHLENLQRRMQTLLRSRVSAARKFLDQLASARVLVRPETWLAERARRLDELHLRATQAIGRHAEAARHRVGALAARLEALSPLAVLQRGYSLTTDLATGQLIRTAEETAPGRTILTRLARGQIVSRVEQIAPDSPPLGAVEAAGDPPG
jgi:exodeoxyribonuclease VII large subunit